MDVIVVLAVAIAVLTVVAAGLAGRVLARQIRRLVEGLGATAAGIRPLLAELSAEAAVTAVELDALRRTAAARKVDPPLH